MPVDEWVQQTDSVPDWQLRRQLFYGLPSVAMLKSSATSSRASMLAAVSGLCRERKSETSILANPSDEGGLVAVLLTIVEKV